MTDRRRTRSLFFSAALLLVGPAFATAADAPPLQTDWQAPFIARLPDPSRQLRLPPGTDPVAWATGQGLTHYRTLYQGREGAIVETSMTDADWQAFESRACGASGGALCETAACQTIQVHGDVSPGESSSANAVRARLVRNEPAQLPTDDDSAAPAGRCSAPPAGLADAPGAGPGINLSIDLTGSPASDEDGNETARADGRLKSFEFELQRSFNDSGGARLGTDAAPDDTSDWTLVVSAGCSDLAIPLDALEPARVPGRITALVQAGSAAAVAAAANLTVLRSIDLDSTDEDLTVFAGASNVAAAAATLLLDPRVSAAQPEYVYRTAAEPGQPAAADSGAPPGYSDPFAALSYGPRLTGVLRLHPAARGGGQLIAVIDTGLDAGHADLQARIRDTVDVTDRGWSADLHGTAVAGIIAANANNAEGGYGVAPGADVLAIKACEPVAAGALRAKCWTSTLVKALDLAMSRNARIINMSLAGPPDDLVARYVGLAIDQNRLVVAAAGNNGPQGRPAHPAALPRVLAVTAVDATERAYTDANLGDYIDLAAPGVDIISPVPGGSYPPLSGTSMAAAHVTGAVALLQELTPLSSAAELAGVLRNAAHDLGDPGDDARFGAGLLDACLAASRATADAVACTGQGGNDAL